MDVNTSHVWYASYGSNILEKRFLCYIGGGKPEGAQRYYEGCKNQALPKANKRITINSELYFAKNSKTWNGGGVGFIKPVFDDKSKTLGRMYLIKVDQFVQLLKQEMRFKGELAIDFKKVIEKGSVIIKEKVWYGRLVFLGMEEGHPIFSFTNEKFLREDISPPNEHYLKIIMEGLKETYNMTDVEIQEYLKSKLGVSNADIETALAALI